MTITENQPPPAHPFYGDMWYRMLDPWHADAFPNEFRDRARRNGERRWGWALDDAFGNCIAFVLDSPL